VEGEGIEGLDGGLYRGGVVGRWVGRYSSYALLGWFTPCGMRVPSRRHVDSDSGALSGRAVSVYES